MKKLFIPLIALFLFGCSDDNKWFDFKNIPGFGVPDQKETTIDVCEFVKGQLRIKGTCGNEGDVLFVMPGTRGDKRIISAPKCSHGRYEAITSKFGRPPCEIIVEDGSGKSARAKVKGTDFYCP
ncbi:hypothetical protein DSCW_43440 [Desulfosarcina widdelii]|uniref:Lipoprotein n=1 Tax=Desulfosarcina widdelii TaxID=947919 RepID=A0A5K7ZLM3_9BACT|nr:hypothetical protein [Desulfosarcina widdelii]BBO76927.1 hypothetical protein DSCW_43440 [Desulfosarcina widdelii]